MKWAKRAAGLCLLAFAAQVMADGGDFLDGLEAIGAGKYGDAEKTLTRAIDADRANAAAHQARGVARTLGGNLDGAIADFQKAKMLAGGKKDWETDAWLAIASKMNNNLNVQFIPGMAPRAEMDYSLALNDMGQNYWQSRYKGSYFDKAQRKQVQTNVPYTGDFAAVAKFYVTKHSAGAAVPVPESLARIEAKLKAGDGVGALAAMKPVLAANAENTDVLALQGEILLGLCDYEGARATFTDLLVRKQSAAAYLNRARALRAMNNILEMKIDRSRAQALDMYIPVPEGLNVDGPYALILPATAWKTLESKFIEGAGDVELKKAAEEFASATSLRRRYDARYQRELADLEAALAEKPANPEAMIKLGRFLHDEAEVMSERVGPRGELKMYRVQSAQDKKRELARADELVDKALRNHPDNLAALTFKAHLKCQSGQYEEAEALVRRALAIKKDDPDLLEVLASLLQVQVARHLSTAGNLKQPKMWFETHFDEYPPAEYIYRRWPGPAELAQAAELEKKAAQLAKLAEECLGKAAEGAGGAGPSAHGWYYRATLQRVRGDTKGARESLDKAVKLDPEYVQAWFQLAGICTELRDGDGAVAARAKAESLLQTTAQAQLNALWHKIPRGEIKTARETVAAGVERDAADPRLPAYLAVIDEAAEKPADALAHFRMAKAIGDHRLAQSGVKFGPAEKNRRPILAEEAALPAAIRLRIGALLLDQGKPADAGAMFAEADAVLRLLAADNGKTQLPDAMLPNPATPAGVVPVADSVATLQVRAAAGALYSQWAAQMKNDDAAKFAAATYRRMFIKYIMTGESAESMRAMADLGAAELYVYSKNFTEAAAMMKLAPAVPQEFWQEMRQTEAAIRAADKR